MLRELMEEAATGAQQDGYLVEDELNVKRVDFAESAEQLGRWRAKPSYRVLGPRLGPRVKDVAALLAQDDGTLAGSLARGEPVTVSESACKSPASSKLFINGRMPPMATSGTRISGRTRLRRSGPTRRKPVLLPVGNMLPTAT